MREPFDIDREVVRILEGDERMALTVLAAFAGEILAGDDELAVTELGDALGHQILNQHEWSDAIEGVLALVRTYSMRKRMRAASGPGVAPRRSNDPNYPS